MSWKSRSKIWCARNVTGAEKLLADLSPHGVPGVFSHQYACQKVFEHAFLAADLVSPGSHASAEASFASAPLDESLRAILDASLKAGAQVDRRMDGKTALTIASGSGSFALVRYLVEKGAELDPELEPANFNATLVRVNVPLLHAICEGHDEIAYFLLERGAEIESEDEEGNTPIMWSIKQGRTQVRDYLTERGADIHKSNAHSQNLLHLCMLSLENFPTEIGVKTLEWLSRRGVDPHQGNWDGLSALQMTEDTHSEFPEFTRAIHAGLAMRAADRLDQQTATSPASLHRSRL
jgi:hypothetical protein